MKPSGEEGIIISINRDFIEDPESLKDGDELELIHDDALGGIFRKKSPHKTETEMMEQWLKNG